MRVSRLPEDESATGWMSKLSATIEFPRLSGDAKVDWVIVGGGFSGVAAARRVAERRPHDDVALVDAVGIGHGSAGRSSGFVVSIGHFSRRSIETNRRIYRLGCAGINSLRASVERFQIPCQWNEAGRLIGASSRIAMRTLSRIDRALASVGCPYRTLEPDDIRRLTGMHGVRSAIHQLDTVLVQPAALLRGLVENLPANVKVYEHSPVTRIEPGKRKIVVCREGTLTTGGIILATNAHLPSFGISTHHVFPMRTFASFASPENIVQPESHHTTQWGFTSSERVGSSFRLLRNGQYLIRNTAFYGLRHSAAERERQDASIAHLSALQRRFPDGGQWTIDRTWSGVIGVTANSALYFDQPQNDVFAIAGHNGHGISHGSIAGELLADWALGETNPLLTEIRMLPAPMWIPKGRPLKMGVGAVMRFLNWRYQGEY